MAEKLEMHKRGDVIDYTPGSDLAAGMPVQIAGQVGISRKKMPALALGALALCGHFKGVLAAVTVVAGQVLGWDADGDPYGGDAGTGCVTNVATSWDYPIGYALYDATNTSGVVYVDLNKHGLPRAIGAFGNPVTTAVPGERHLEAYTENTAESGSSKGLYWGHHVAGAGGSGAGGDFYGWAAGVAAANLSGLHAAAFFTGGGSITGLGVGFGATLEVPDAALIGGTYAGAQSELHMKGANSDISGATRHSIHRFVLGGNVPAKATANTVFEFAGLTSGTGADDMVKTDQHSHESTDGLRCIVNNEVKYLLLAD